MNIWLEISNSPHINLFSGMLEDLVRAHEIIVTARPLANRVQLLKLHGIKHTVGRTVSLGRLLWNIDYVRSET
jgi:predicted glycosyltransferase